MKKQIAAGLIGVLLFTGCQTLHLNGDPVVIGAEEATQSAMDVFDTFLQFEYYNRGYLQKVAPSAYPQIHSAAERIRHYGVGWLNTARNLTKAYKNNRTATNKANLATAISTIQQASLEAQNWMNQLGSNAPSPTPIPTPTP